MVNSRLCEGVSGSAERRDGREEMALVSQSRARTSIRGARFVDCGRTEGVFDRDFLCLEAVLVKLTMLSSMFFLKWRRT